MCELLCTLWTTPTSHTSRPWLHAVPRESPQRALDLRWGTSRSSTISLRVRISTGSKRGKRVRIASSALLDASFPATAGRGAGGRSRMAPGPLGSARSLTSRAWRLSSSETSVESSFSSDGKRRRMKERYEGFDAQGLSASHRIRSRRRACSYR